MLTINPRNSLLARIKTRFLIKATTSLIIMSLLLIITLIKNLVRLSAAVFVVFLLLVFKFTEAHCRTATISLNVKAALSRVYDVMPLDKGNRI